MIIIAVLQSLGILSFCSKNTAFYYKCFATESYLYRSTFATLICKHCDTWYDFWTFHKYFHDAEMTVRRFCGPLYYGRTEDHHGPNSWILLEAIRWIWFSVSLTDGVDVVFDGIWGGLNDFDRNALRMKWSTVRHVHTLLHWFIL